MRPGRVRLLAVIGGVILIGSIFLPRPGTGSIAGELEAWWGALILTLQAENARAAEIVPLAGIVMALAYLPLCGLICALCGMTPRRLASTRFEVVSVLLLHTVFAGVLLAMGVGGVVVEDEWLPRPLYWGVAAVAAIVLISAWLIGLRTRREARLLRVNAPALAAIALGCGGTATWLALQSEHGWSPWGLAASATGAVLALIATCLAPGKEPA